MLYYGVRQRINRIILCFYGILIFLLVSPLDSFSASMSEQKYFDILVNRLVKDGFDRKQIKMLFHRPDVHFETQRIARFSVHKEAKLNYNQFLSRSNIRKTRQYLKKYQTALQNAEKKYGVDKEIVTAVMLVETRLGTYLGGSSTLNTLSTMAVLSDSKSREFIWSQIAKTKGQKKNLFISWSDRKTDWAYKELKAFLTYTQKEKIDPMSINGSYAGAIGICQFMPSNVIKLAKDGNQDGRINLFHHADAIASIANFLKFHGWKPGLKRQKQYKVLLRYNYSKPYANTLIDIAQNLKG
jgi:membrane-bound lytic murein transglycosylase B